jgi:methylenetetrahydrofolate dehydrogenase (NADP+) / methenyltetrahydrofolate cyclohydrolase
MPAKIIDGRAMAEEIRAEIRADVEALRAERGITPRIAFVLVGDDPGSRYYVTSKGKTAAALGIESEDHHFSADVSEEELLTLIDTLNGRPEVHGILVQMPIPAHMDKQRMLMAVDPRKDVDGLHPLNVGRLVIGRMPMPTCTPAGVMEMLRRSGVEFKGAEAVVVGRSDIVGKPVAMMLLHEHATVTMCHSRTRDLPGVCRRADILVVAIGRARLVDASFVKPGAAVIDVGINRVDGKVVGDVDFEAVAPVAGYLSPVPYGVGPMTITMLLRNTVTAARLASGG